MTAYVGSRGVVAGLLGVILACGLLTACSTQLTPEEAEGKMTEAFRKTVRSGSGRDGAGMLVHSDSLGIHVMERADPTQPDAFHAASVGKAFTTVIIGKLIDSGKLGFDTPVAPLLGPHDLDGLFVVDGRDLRGEVTVGQLLSHTSGVADYFGDKGKSGKSISDLLVSDPERLWTPRELLDFSRGEQHAVGRPGSVFHYSDTGFLILGMIAEAVTGGPFELLLSREVFDPLGMNRTWMPYRSLPRAGSAGPLRHAWLNGIEVSSFKSITADWAGGGVATTEEDLLRFQQALWSGKLLSPRTLAALQDFDNVFERGIHYGRGLMQLRFEEFFFLLKGYPSMVGHMGITAAQMFSDPAQGLHVVVTLGSDAAMQDSVKLIIEVLGILARTGER